MEEEVIREIISLLKDIKGGVPISAISLFLLGIIVLITSILGSYLKIKGQNLAIKEDIADITRKVEGIKIDYAKELEDFSHHNKLKMAALDKRLAAHQEAYKMWLQLRRFVHNKEKSIDIVIKCQIWWEENCLYLDKDAREAFISACHAVALHSDLIVGEVPKEEVSENWKIINGGGEAIIRGAGLPSFGKDELETIDKIGKINS